jgi:hypothetical protein
MSIRVPPPEAVREICELALAYIDARRRMNELLSSRPQAREAIAEARQERRDALIALRDRHDDERMGAPLGWPKKETRTLHTIRRLWRNGLNPPSPGDLPGLEGDVKSLLEAATGISSRRDAGETARDLVREGFQAMSVRELYQMGIWSDRLEEMAQTALLRGIIRDYVLREKTLWVKGKKRR